MKTLAFLFIVFACLASNAMGEQFRIATYNLNWANQRGDQVLDAISTAKPDLICFQETTLQSERFLRDRLSAEFPHFVAVGHQGRYAAERFAFASKVPLADVEFTPPDAGLFGFCAATVRVGGDAIRIVNVHLTPVVLSRGHRFAAVMNALSDAEAKHKSEITAITKGLDLDKPIIVLGDFNSISSFIAPKTLADMGMVDSFASVVANPDTHATWTWPTRPLPISLRIDYLFHTKHFSTNESAVIRREGSDHSLVVSELLLKAADVSSTRSE